MLFCAAVPSNPMPQHQHCTLCGASALLRGPRRCELRTCICMARQGCCLGRLLLATLTLYSMLHPCRAIMSFVGLGRCARCVWSPCEGTHAFRLPPCSSRVGRGRQCSRRAAVWLYARTALLLLRGCFVAQAGPGFLADHTQMMRPTLHIWCSVSDYVVHHCDIPVVIVKH